MKEADKYEEEKDITKVTDRQTDRQRQRENNSICVSA